MESDGGTISSASVAPRARCPTSVGCVARIQEGLGPDDPSESVVASMGEAPMPCDRCEELELRHVSQTEEYISFVERQSRKFRNGEAQSGRELDREIVAAKTAMHEG